MSRLLLPTYELDATVADPAEYVFRILNLGRTCFTDLRRYEVDMKLPSSCICDHSATSHPFEIIFRAKEGGPEEQVASPLDHTDNNDDDEDELAPSPFCPFSLALGRSRYPAPLRVGCSAGQSRVRGCYR